MNSQTSVDDSPPCLCAQALPTLLRELIALPQRYPIRRILPSKTDFHEPFRNVRINTDCAPAFGYVFDRRVGEEFRLLFGWTLSPPDCGVPSEAVVFSKCHNTKELMRLLEGGRRTIYHIRIERRQESGRPAPIPNDVPVRSAMSGGINDPFFAVLYADGVALVRVQQDDDDEAVLQVSVLLASNFVSAILALAPPRNPRSCHSRRGRIGG